MLSATRLGTVEFECDGLRGVRSNETSVVARGEEKVAGVVG